MVMLGMKGGGTIDHPHLVQTEQLLPRLQKLPSIAMLEGSGGKGGRGGNFKSTTTSVIYLLLALGRTTSPRLAEVASSSSYPNECAHRALTVLTNSPLHCDTGRGGGGGGGTQNLLLLKYYPPTSSTGRELPLPSLQTLVL